MPLARFWLLRFALAALLLGPALLPSVIDASPTLKDRLEELTLSIYGGVARLGGRRLAPTSQVEVIEINRDDVAHLGWPIPHGEYANLLHRLTTTGRPWLLSLVDFQKATPAEDATLATEIASYGRVIGSGLDVERDEELTDEGEELAKAKSFLGKTLTPATNLPRLPLYMREAETFVKAQAHFGVAPRFGVTPVIYCLPLYLEDVSHSGDLVLPTSALWSLALWSGRSVVLDHGASWTNPDARHEEALPISEKHCMSHPEMPTRELLGVRGIKVRSFTSVLDGRVQIRGDRLVILAAEDMRLFQGPGEKRGDDGVVGEHLLLARLLDDVMAEASIRRPTAPASRAMLGPIAAVVLAVCALLFRPLVVILLGTGIVGALASVMAWRMAALQEFFIPTDGFLVVGLGIGLFAVGVRVARGRVRHRHENFLDTLRFWLSKCNTLGELEEAAANSFLGSFRNAAVTVGDFDGRLHGTQEPGLDDGDASVLSAASVGAWSAAVTVALPASAEILYVATLAIAARVDILRGDSRRGTVSVVLPRVDLAPKAARRFLTACADEIALHWERVEALQIKNAVGRHNVAVAKEMHLGQMIQSLLLPSAMAGRWREWAFQMVFQPHGAMSGDWIQTWVPEVDGARIAGTAKRTPDAERGSEPAVFAIGDVAGKGTSAALITAAIAGAWSKLRLGADPVADMQLFLRDLDDMIRRLFKGQQYTTLSLLILDGDEVNAISCGAQPWVIVGADGTVRKLRGVPRDPLGVGPTLVQEGVTVRKLEILPGEALIAYTDGVMDGWSSFRRLRALFQDQRLPEGDAAFAVIQDLVWRAGAPFVLPDDRTLLMLRRVQAEPATAAA